jgi:hypothetical protein
MSLANGTIVPIILMNITNVHLNNLFLSKKYYGMLYIMTNVICGI